MTRLPFGADLHGMAPDRKLSYQDTLLTCGFARRSYGWPANDQSMAGAREMRSGRQGAKSSYECLGAGSPVVSARRTRSTRKARMASRNRHQAMRYQCGPSAVMNNTGSTSRSVTAPSLSAYQIRST